MMRKSWIRRLAVAAILAVLLLPPLLFGLSNLYLMSPPGRDFLAGKIGGRTGLETKLQGASWSPWNGFTLYGLRMEQPGPLKDAFKAPLVAVDSIRVVPGWREFARRQIMIRGIDLHRADLTLPIELLSHINSPEPPPAQVEVPTALADPVPKDAPPMPELTPAPPVAPAPTPTPPAMAAAPELEPAPAPSGQPPPEITSPTVWINFSETRLRVVTTMTEQPLYEIGRIDGKLPVGGKAAETNFKLKNIRTLGNRLAAEMVVPMEWRSPVLKLAPLAGGFFGLDCNMEAGVSFTQGLPFQIAGVIPKQDGKKVVIGEILGAEMGSVAGEARLQGFLHAPASWQGQAVIQAVEMKTRYGEKDALFEQGQALFSFQNGALRCVDAKLLGEPLSILGNAALLTDGRAAGNARIVAAPDTLVALSKLTQPETAPHLTPLSTPQRSALDLQIYGRPGEFYFQPDPRAAPLLMK